VTAIGDYFAVLAFRVGVGLIERSKTVDGHFNELKATDQ